MIDLETCARAVCQIARQAGTYIREERLKFSVDRVERKHAHDYVSYVDKGSEQLIVSALHELLPEAGFVTEEGTTLMSDAGSQKSEPSFLNPQPSSLCWVVDPLDGTTNFIHQYAPYCVSIALLQDSEVLVGVVYEICADECYYAWKGGGAYLEMRNEKGEMSNEKGEMRNEKGEMRNVPLRVSHVVVEDALLCLQLPYNSEAYKPVVSHLIDTFYGHAASIRMIGSAAMALCYVAVGRLDGYAEQFIGRWDYMAGSLIVMEAGGIVTDYSGSTDFTCGNSIVATNGLVHQDLLEAISQNQLEKSRKIWQ